MFRREWLWLEEGLKFVLLKERVQEPGILSLLKKLWEDASDNPSIVMRQRQWSFVCVTPEHTTATSGWKLEGGWFQFIIEMKFVMTRISQWWGCEASFTENIQRAGWPPWGHCRENAYTEMRNFGRHLENVPKVSSMNSVAGSSFQIISQQCFFFPIFCSQLKHCSISIVLNEDFEKVVER